MVGSAVPAQVLLQLNEDGTPNTGGLWSWGGWCPHTAPPLQEGCERRKAAMGGLVVQLRLEVSVLFCVVLHVVHQVDLFFFVCMGHSIVLLYKEKPSGSFKQHLLVQLAFLSIRFRHASRPREWTAICFHSKPPLVYVAHN